MPLQLTTASIYCCRTCRTARFGVRKVSRIHQGRHLEHHRVLPVRVFHHRYHVGWGYCTGSSRNAFTAHKYKMSTIRKQEHKASRLQIATLIAGSTIHSMQHGGCELPLTDAGGTRSVDRKRAVPGRILRQVGLQRAYAGYPRDSLYAARRMRTPSH